MFSYTTLKNIIGKDVALSQTMIDAINKWKKMLVGNADWCSDIVESLKLEEGICREFADSVLVEMEAKILNNDKMDKVLQKSLSDMNKKLQTGLALGAMVLRPLGPDTAEYVAADKFIVISFADDGTPNDIAFLVVKCVGENDYYTRVERHYFTNGNLTIENKCYHSQSQSDIGQICSLEEVVEWANILPGPVIYPGMVQMDFGYYQNPIENKVDGSACGVSIYESAENLIRKADIQGARLDWEYDSGERAIHIDELTATTHTIRSFREYRNATGRMTGSKNRTGRKASQKSSRGKSIPYMKQSRDNDRWRQQCGHSVKKYRCFRTEALIGRRLCSKKPNIRDSLMNMRCFLGKWG